MSHRARRKFEIAPLLLYTEHFGLELKKKKRGMHGIFPGRIPDSIIRREPEGFDEPILTMCKD